MRPELLAISAEEASRHRHAVEHGGTSPGSKGGGGGPDAEVRTVETEIERRTVRAPIACEVLQVKLRAGEIRPRGSQGGSCSARSIRRTWGRRGRARDIAPLSGGAGVCPARLEAVENALVTHRETRRRLINCARPRAVERRAVVLGHRSLPQRARGFSRWAETERTLYAAQTELARGERAVSQDLVRLYKAPGGG